MKKDQFEIRDCRNGNWFWIHTHVWHDKRLTQSEKVLYGTLASYTNIRQKSFPSIDLIAKISNLSARHIHRCLKKLEALKYLGIERKDGKTNIYTLLKTTPDTMSPVTNRHVGGDKKTPLTITNNNIRNTNKLVLAKNSPKGTDRTPKYGNALVNHVLEEFQRLWGFEATDRKPRQEAWNLVRRLRKYLPLDVPEERLSKAIGKYLFWISEQDWAQGIQTLGTVKRKMNIFVAENNLQERK